MKYLLIFLFGFQYTSANCIDVYLIPGLGVDSRVYDKVNLENHNIIYLEHLPVRKNESFQDYAMRYAECIDTTKAFVLVGLSLGGMIAIEMLEYMNPEAVILVSSANGEKELPMRYRWLRIFPLHWFIGSNSMKIVSWAFPIVSPLDRYDEELYCKMIRDHDPRMLRYHISFISGWRKEYNSSTMIHNIHGDKDPFIPKRNKARIDYLLAGHHKLLITNAPEIELLLDEIIKKAASDTSGS